MILSLFRRKKKVVEIEPAPVAQQPVPPQRNYIDEAALGAYCAPVHKEELLPCESGLLEQPRCRIDEKYQRINPSFLSWVKLVDGIPLPVFAVFNPFMSPGTCHIELRSWNLANSHFHLKAEMFGYSSATDEVTVESLHPLIQPYANWALEYEKVKRGESVSLTCHFSSLIPDETRKKIRIAKDVFSHVAIVTEADWRVKAIPSIDPLVIGVCGRTCWLIDKFDLTAIERIAASEFSYSI